MRLSRRELPFRVVSVALGSVLIGAAAVKAYSTPAQNMNQDQPQDAIPIGLTVVALIELELLAGLCLVVGLSSRLTWAIGLGCFTILAVAALSMALGGQRTCGCVGSAPVTPWQAATFDGCALLALLVCRPSMGSSVTRAPLKRSLIVIAAGWAVLGTTMACVAARAELVRRRQAINAGKWY